jgi:hypothetical protein
MHDLDRTQLEFESEEPEGGFEGEDFEFGTEEIDSQQMESPFSEEEEMELASELLEITDEQELDQFLGSLFKKIGRGIKGAVASPLGGMLKGIAKKALPVVGGALGTVFGGPAGGMIGSKLASGAGSLFGLELEGLSQEDQEFEVAKRYVRLAGSAAQRAAMASPTIPPQTAARNAVIEAAKIHAPGFLRRADQYGRSSRIPRHCKSGRWYRRGNKIVICGVY